MYFQVQFPVKPDSKPSYNLFWHQNGVKDMDGNIIRFLVVDSSSKVNTHNSSYSILFFPSYDYSCALSLKLMTIERRPKMPPMKSKRSKSAISVGFERTQTCSKPTGLAQKLSSLFASEFFVPRKSTNLPDVKMTESETIRICWKYRALKWAQ